MRRLPALLAAFVLLTTLTGCKSTQKRYEKATQLEAQERWAEAARYYIDVLEREPEFAEARDRLEVVGANAIDDYLAAADAALAEGLPDDAILELDNLDALRADADDVGVTLAVPADYADYRGRVQRQALVVLLQEGDRAEQAADWSEALAAYDRALEYAESADTEDEIREAQGRVHLKWAQQEVEREHYRGGFDRATHVAEYVGPDHPLAREALALQEDALAAGTHYVAFLPLAQTDAARRATPRDLVRDLNDVLTYDHWAAPVPFIAAADPVQLRRELRRLRYEDVILSRRDAADIGRVVDADLVVAGEMTKFEAEERNIRNRERNVKLRARGGSRSGRSSVDTVFVEQTYTLDFDATVEYRIIDTRTQRVLDQGSVRASASERLKRGVFDGNWEDLDLSGSQRELFEDTDRLGREELTNELVDELALDVAERVYERLLREIP